MGTQLWRSSARDLADMIAKRKASSREVVEAHLERIGQVNGRLNAVVRVLADEALAAADAADAAVEADRPLGVFHGVPFTVKENIDVVGTPTTNSLPALAEVIASSDAPAVERMRRAGAIPIGRTNLPDLGLRVHTDSSLHGLTRNPWHADRTAGGSSGGEASAIASGMSPMGLGNDIGGSLRNPAHCCGITSLKPTVGRVPYATSVPPFDPMLAAQLMISEGPMARSVGDLRAMLGVLAGAHVRDPKSVPVPLDLDAPRRPLRIALLADPPGGSTDAGIAAVVEDAARHLASAGHVITDLVPPRYEAVLETWSRLLIADVRCMRPLLEMVMGPNALLFMNQADDTVEDLTAEAVFAVHTERHALLREWAAYFTEVDLILSPTWAQPAFIHGADIADRGAEATLELIRPVLPANLLGLPAAVVPGGLSASMPVGVQLTGWLWNDLDCLDAAADIENAVGQLTPIDPSF